MAVETGAVVLSLLVAELTFAADIAVDPSGGHAYELVYSSSITWTNAKAAAEASTPPTGYAQGHLVTFSDATEETFLISAFGNALNGKWIGFTDATLEGEWRWIDDTPGIWQDPDNFGNPVQTAYANWRTSTREPNNDGNEDYAVYSLYSSPVLVWNDLANALGGRDGYVVEYAPTPRIDVSPSQLTFTGQLGQANPPPQMVTVGVVGAGSLYYTATSDASWLLIYPGGGGPLPPAAAENVSVDLTGLSHGVYHANVIFSPSGTGANADTVSVALTVQDASECGNQFSLLKITGYQKIGDGQGGLPSNALDDGDHFGGSIAQLGDLDGDGFGDVAVSAHADDDGGTDRGAVWVLFLNADGSIKNYHKISSTSGDLDGLLADHDVFGLGVERLGDLDGDGVPDMVAGASNDGGTGKGAVWILFLNRDGTVKARQKISGTEGGFSGTLDDNDYFGNAAALLGDIDGHRALAVSAPWDDDGGTDRGAVYVLFLDPDGTVDHYQKISSTTGNFGGVLHDEDVFGCEVAPVGDLDGDGVCDMAVGAQWDDDGGLDRGAVWIVFLNADGSVKASQKISATEGGFTGILDYYDNFGSDMASLGVLDIDGDVGLAVGASYDDDRASDAGAIWVLFLKRDGTVRGFQKSCDLPGGFTGTLHDGDLFGSGLASLGDINHNGFNDLAVGASWDNGGGLDRGAVWMLFQDKWTTDVSDDAEIARLHLYSSYPNPFNPRTTIRFDIPVGGRVRLEVYDIAGRLVRTLLDADLPAGSHQAVWDGKDAAGRGMPSGSYFARLSAGGLVETVRMGLVR